nr:hypothetical protein [Tanacetum cinerariifolium]
DQWIFDSGCSRHMTGNKSFLTKYQHMDGRFVAFGGSPKGGIQIDIHAGQASQEKSAVHEYILLPFIPLNPPLSLTIQSSDVNVGDKPGDADDGDKPGDVNAGDIQGDVDEISRNDDVCQGNEIRIDNGTHAVNVASPSINIASNIIDAASLNINIADSNHTNMPTLETTNIFDGAFDDRDLVAEADTNILDSSTVISREGQIIKIFKTACLLVSCSKRNPRRLHSLSDGCEECILYGKIEEEVYVCQPPRFEDLDFPDKVYKVKKALYGLHQAPRACQDKYVAEILKKFRFFKVKTASTPMETSKPLLKDEDRQEVDVHMYISKIGSIMYLTSLRPDIMFVVCACARHQVSPKASHLHAVKRIFRYLKGQPKLVVANSTTEAEYVAASSCYGQAMAKVKKVDDQEQTQVLVDKKKIIIMEDNIRSDLHFDDAEGTACLLNEAIFEGLVRMGAKTTAWNEISSTMASAIICLADNQKFNSQNKQVEGMARHKEMYIISSHTKKIFANMRRIGAGFSGIITPLFDTMMKKQNPRRRQRKEAEVSNDDSEDEDHIPTPSSDPLPSGRRVKPHMEKDSLGAQEDASKQGRMIEEIDQNAEIALDDETQGRKNDDEMFGFDDIAGEEVVMETTIGEHEEQIIEDVSTAEPVTTAGEVVTTTTVKDSAASITYVTKDEITMAQELDALKSIKPKVVVQEQEMSTIIPAVATTVTTAVPTLRAKGKAKMIEPEVPIKKKDQTRIDEECSRKLEAEEQEAARLNKAQQDEEANNSWDNIQAIMDDDRLLAKRIQAREREEFSKGKSFDEIKKLFDKEKRKVNDFIAMDSEAQESSIKRTTEHLEHDISKKQKVDENVKPVIDDSEELKKCIEIVLDNGDDVHIEATPLSSRSPTTIDYEIHKEGKKTYFKIIRADGNSQVYQTFEKMFRNFNREDLEVLWAIIKDKFKKEKQVDDMDNLLFRTLKTMFEHHVEDNIWKYQQGLAKMKNQKLFESCKVYVKQPRVQYTTCWLKRLSQMVEDFVKRLRSTLGEEGRPLFDDYKKGKKITAGSESRPPLLNKENYVPWSSRLLRYAKSRPNGKLIHNSILNRPYVKKMIPEPGDANREITTILLGLPEDIYAAVDSCETAQKIWLRVQQMMKGSDIGIQEKKAKLFNEWERFTSNEGESIESYSHYFLKLMNDLKRNKHFLEKIASNLKFLNNLQLEWSRHVTIVHQTKDLHTADYTQLHYRSHNCNGYGTRINGKSIQAKLLNTNQQQSENFIKPKEQAYCSTGNQVIQNAVQNPRVQNVRNQNGLIGVQENGNQNQIGNGNLVAARAEGNAAGQNGNQIRCYNYKGVGHYARNCTVRPKRRDAAYLQTHLLIGQKEEAGILLQAEVYDLMVAAADLDEIKEVNANCILMASLQQASTSGIQTDSAPVYDTDGSAE